MWDLHLRAIAHDYDGKPLQNWVVYIKHKSDTAVERLFRDRREEMFLLLLRQNTFLTEVTTGYGQKEIYEKFDLKNRAHPLFLIFNTHPSLASKSDRFIVVEWGLWKDMEELKRDVFALLNFFSDAEFRAMLAEAKTPTAWKKAKSFIGQHGVAIAVGIGTVIAA